MRGSLFIAVFLILVGLVFVIATFRGRAPQLYDALAMLSGGATGTTGSRTPQTNSTRSR